LSKRDDGTEHLRAGVLGGAGSGVSVYLCVVRTL
jgi:hypothetical protein